MHQYTGQNSQSIGDRISAFFKLECCLLFPMVMNVLQAKLLLNHYMELTKTLYVIGAKRAYFEKKIDFII